MTKIVNNTFLGLLLLVSVSAEAAPGPPPPSAPPVGLPIDSNLGMLMLIVVIYGLYKINKYKMYKKTLN